MYWCSPAYKKFVCFTTGFILLVAIQSCSSDAPSKVQNVQFFDLKKYFTDEAGRLTKLNPLITKTAAHNTISETDKMRITSWTNELSSFTESDINKPAWKASYTVQSTNDFLIYKAKDPELKTRDIIIKKDGSSIKWILIFNHTTGLMAKKVLYEMVEKLSYFPDSLYLIQKTQRVRLMGTNTYNIRGEFK